METNTKDRFVTEFERVKVVTSAQIRQKSRTSSTRVAGYKTCVRVRVVVSTTLEIYMWGSGFKDSDMEKARSSIRMESSMKETGGMISGKDLARSGIITMPSLQAPLRLIINMDRDKLCILMELFSRKTGTTAFWSGIKRYKVRITKTTRTIQTPQ